MRRILYIEDDLEIGSWVKEDLEQRGYKVEWLKSGDGAEKMVSDHDLVILDVLLPGLDGFTIGQRFKGQCLYSEIHHRDGVTCTDSKSFYGRAFAYRAA